MNIFFDTNVILEFLADREEADLVADIITLCDKNNWNKFLSVGSVYTLAYLTERILHKQGLVRPELTDKQRLIFQDILSSFEIIPLDSQGIAEGTKDIAFADLEDSFQYRSALQADCDILLTINIKDFRKAEQKNIIIFEPQSFLEKYKEK